MPGKRNQSAALFARNFFHWLEEHGIPSVVLHGGKDGFEGGISDIDFSVQKNIFSHLSSLIHNYCLSRGWLLCQAFQHETTATYFVCSSADDPECSVALDACSDYQRNGITFLDAESLLAERQLLPWGGWEPSAFIQLRYRFAKAAAKAKKAAVFFEEFLSYPREARDSLSRWLEGNWKIPLHGWELSDITQALSLFQAQCKRGPAIFQPGSLARILSRVTRPSGMVVACDSETSDHLATVFGRVHFRRVIRTESLGLPSFKALVQSTLILTPRLRGWSLHFIPRDCLLPLNNSPTPEAASAILAAALHKRLVVRESLNPRDAFS